LHAALMAQVTTGVGKPESVWAHPIATAGPAAILVKLPPQNCPTGAAQLAAVTQVSATQVPELWHVTVSATVISQTAPPTLHFPWMLQTPLQVSTPGHWGWLGSLRSQAVVVVTLHVPWFLAWSPSTQIESIGVGLGSPIKEVTVMWVLSGNMKVTLRSNAVPVDGMLTATVNAKEFPLVSHAKFEEHLTLTP